MPAMQRLVDSPKKVIMWIIVPVLILLVLLAFSSGPARRPAPGGISQLEQVELGGMKQWISIRGADLHAPVLLFLHGGPGSANLAKLRLQVPELEQHFVVVTWDQRGAGKSAPIGFDYDCLSIDQMVSDTHALVSYLKARFGVEKFYLMGFSWGSIIGLNLADQYPEDLYAYIGVSQVINPRESERISLDFVQENARQAGNDQAIDELSGIDPAYKGANWFKQLSIERKWLLQYGGVYYTTRSYSHEVMLLSSHEYSLAEVALWPGRSSVAAADVAGSYAGEFQVNHPGAASTGVFFRRPVRQQRSPNYYRRIRPKADRPGRSRPGLVRKIGPRPIF